MDQQKNQRHHEPNDWKSVKDALEEEFQFLVLSSQFSVLSSQVSVLRFSVLSSRYSVLSSEPPHLPCSFRGFGFAFFCDFLDAHAGDAVSV
jgi:hypothetical protein